MCCRDPVDGCLHLAICTGESALCIRIVRAVNFDDGAAGILYHFFTFDDVGVAEADFGAGGETVIFRRRHFTEIVRFDVEFAAKGDLPRTGRCVFGIIDCFEKFRLTLRVIGNNDFDRMQHSHCTLCLFVQIFANAVFKQRHVDGAVPLRHADDVAEILDGVCSISTAAVSGKGRHAGIIPAGNVPFFHQLQELALAQNCK